MTPNAISIGLHSVATVLWTVLAVRGWRHSQAGRAYAARRARVAARARA
ncbi:hypothetical protein [Streptomyces sp. NPDC057838]